MTTQIGCIRFRNDAPPSADASTDTGVEVDAEVPAEAGDVVVVAPPICARFDSTIASSIANDLISLLGSDCVLRRHFAHLPPTAIGHLRTCFTAQIGQVMGCKQANGEPFRYPVEYAPGRQCRDMKSSHSMLGISDGDFTAFANAIGTALDLHGLTGDEKAPVMAVFNATRNDIVEVQPRDSGPTKPCDPPDAAP